MGSGDFVARIRAEINMSDVQRQLDSLTSKIEAQLSKAFSSTKVTVDTDAISRQFYGAGTAIGNALSDAINSSLKNVNSSSIGKSVSKSFDDGTASVKRFAAAASKALNTGSIDSSVAKMSMQYEKLASTGHSGLSKVSEDITHLITLQNELKGNLGQEELGAKYKDFSETLARVKNKLQEISAESKTFASSLQINNLDNKMLDWLRKNTNATEQFGDKINELRTRLAGLGNGTGSGVKMSEFKAIEAEFNSINNQANRLGLLGGKMKPVQQEAVATGNALTGAFKKATGSLASYFSTVMLINKAIQTFKKMYTAVYDVNTAMTELKKVTDESNATYDRFLSGAGDSAKKIGTTIKDYISSTADFARLGYSFGESQELAKVASVYAVVGDELNGIDDATKHIISTMTAFRAEGAKFASQSDFAMSIVDKYNEIGNNFAISSGGLGTAMERSASSLAAANNTIDESLALITAANTVVQNPENVGTAFKTLTMRIRGAKTELTEAGLETDGMATSTAKLREQILALSGVDIMEDADTFKSTFRIMDELSQKWGDLTDIQQASILELTAGKRQGNIVAALLNNFDIAREALEAASNSEGSAMQEHARWMESLEAKTNQFKTAFEGLSQATLNSDFLGGAIDSGTRFLDILTWIVEKLGPLPPLIGAVAASFSLFKNVGIFSSLKSDAGGFLNSLSLMNVSVTDLVNTFKRTKEAVGGGAGGVLAGFKSIGNLLASGITSKDISVINRYNAALGDATITQEQLTAITGEASEAGRALINSANGQAISLTNLGKGAAGSVAGMVAARAAAVALNAAISAGLTIAIQFAITQFDHLIHAAEEASQAADERASKSSQAFSKIKEESNQIDVLIQKYKELAQSDTQDAGTRDEIAGIQAQITSLVGQQASNLDLVNGKLDEETAKLQGIQDIQGSSAIEAAVSAYTDAKEAENNAIGEVKGTFQNGGFVGQWDYIGKRDKEAEAIFRASDDPDIKYALKNAFGYNQLSQTYLNYDEKNPAKKKIEVFNKMIKMLEDNATYDYSSSDIYSGLIKARDHYQEYVDKTSEAAENLLDAVMNTNAKDISDKGVNSLKAFEKYRSDLLESLKNDQNLKGAIDDGIIDEETLGKHVDAYLGTLDKFSDYYAQWSEKISKQKSLETLTEKFGADAVRGLEEYSAGALESLTKYIEENPNATLDEAKSVAELRDGLYGLAQSYSDVARAKAEYDAAVENGAKDDDYKAFAEAYKKMQEEITAGRTDSVEYNAAAKMLLGEDMLDELKWDPSKINAQIKQLSTAFGDAENSGYGLIQTLNKIAENGQILGDNGELLASISTNDDGTLALEVVAGKFDELAKKTGMSEEALKACYEALGNFGNLNLYDFDKISEALEPISSYATGSDFDGVVKSALQKLGEGGSVDLTVRPKVDTSELKKVGWEDVGEGIATVYTKTYSNEAKDVAINFTPILVDENGNYAGVLSPEELDEYAEAVINGAEDTKHLQIGTEFNGDDAIEQAEAAADLIHKLHEYTATGVGDVSELSKEIATYMESVGASVDGFGSRYVGLEAFKQQLNDLGVEGREVYDIMRELEDREGIKFFDVNDDIETLKTNLQDLGALTIGEDGGIDINVDSLLETAGHLGFTTDEVSKLVDALREIDGVDFTDTEGNLLELGEIAQKIIDSTDIAKPDALVALQEQADAAGQSLEEFAERLFGLEEGSLHINVDDLENASEKVTALEETIETLKNKRLELADDENSAEAVAQIDALLQDCIQRKQMLSAPAIMSIDASSVGEADVELGNAIAKIQEFVNLSNELENITDPTVDTTDIQTKLAAVAGELAALPDETKTALGLDTTDFDAAITSISETEVNVEAGVEINAESLAAVNTAISGISKATIEASVNSAPVVTALGTVKTAVEAIPDEKNISVSAATATAYSNLSSVATMLRSIQSKSITVTVNRVVKTTEKGGGSAQGTAHAQGTAKKSGDWRVGRDTTSLVGELGPELVVRDGKFFTVGDDSAEMVNLKKNDIVFNAEQTRQILLNGKITNGAKRGVAYAGGSISSNAVYRLTIPNWVSLPGAKVGYSSNSYTNDDDEPKEFDYIETALARIERAVDSVKDKASSASKSIDTRLKATGEEISAITAEIDMQSDAYDRYMREANAVGLSSSIAQKVRDGIIDITEYDDDTTKLINQYKDWYEKALDCADAIDELHESIADLYKDSFDNIQSYYKGFISQFEHMANTYDTKIDMFEAMGYQVNESLYRDLIATTQSSVYAMELELTDLKEAFATAMNSGEIEENSEAWFDMRQEIDDLTESIDKGYLEIVKFDKKIRELSWDNFDFILDRIEEINDESEFFIKMMEDNDLFDDSGIFTQYGTAVAGLHLEKYNVSMSQAKKYAEELRTINRKIAEDPYDRELLERREELYHAQRKSIEAAKDEKDAIVDMVRDGIDVELDALDELISKYKDALDSSQDLYDYERKIEDETGEISKIQKQLLAYSGDDSEEAMAKRQKLNEDLKEAQKNLEETQYDKYIRDQKSMLDAFYTDYETAVNKRLDNVDALLSEVAGNINDAALDISDTIKKVAESFGYDLTSEMKSMWGARPLSDQVSDVITRLESSLGIKSVEEKNGSDIANDKPKNYKPPTSEKETKPNSETTPKTNTEDKAISVGGMINAGSASIFTSAYGGNALKQYFASDPIYTVLDEKNGFLLVRHHSLSKGSTGWFRKTDVKAYKNGGLIDYTGLAWVDGSKAKPEYILNSENTDSLLKMSNNARALSELPISSGGLPYSLGVGNVYSGVFNAAAETIASIIKTIGSDRDGFGDINVENEFNIPIDHVENYEDFVTKMQSDSKFNDMILAMTIDPLVGKSKFGKYKYKW